MKLNDIKFTPKSNAFAEVYGKATGMPFVGELVAAAAGNGGEPTPTSDYIVLAPPTVIDPWYDTNPKLECSGGSCGVNMLFLSDLPRTTVTGACTVEGHTDSGSLMANQQISGTGTEYDGMYTLDWVFAFDGLTEGNHNFSVVLTADGETFNINGTFTVPEEPAQI